MERLRLLIFIVAYNAEALIKKTLSRIPRNIYKEYDYEILIIDDSSTDNTYLEGMRFKLENTHLNIKVLFNPENMGYGGNQKLGYCYAIENNFDIVVLLHGDGQYAPELIEDIIKPIVKDNADIVIGSRMIKKGQAIRGGMPKYKYFGNKILTFAQNKILNAKLSEFHSGYRAYRVKALKNIPFERNTNDFHFDTQILIQFLHSKDRIVEIPIPTYYGNEICYVNGIKYAFNVIRASILSRIHNMFILYQREYDINKKPEYKSKFGFLSSHSIALSSVENNSKVLDIGCNEGYLAKELKEKKCYVVGIDSIKIENKNNFDKFINMDLNKPEKLPFLDIFDYILILDVLEHLNDPEMFLDQVRAKTKLSKPKIIITVPNVAFFLIRFQLFFGNFNYGKQGILDLSHKRLFTFRSIIKLCESCGYKIKKIRGIPAPFPIAVGNNRLGRFLLNLNKFLISCWKTMFSYQIYLEIVPTPVVKELLNLSIRHSSKKELNLI